MRCEYLDLKGLRAMVVRNGVKAVQDALSTDTEGAVRRLTKATRQRPGQVLLWMRQEISRAATWQRWCAAVDALTGVKDETHRGEHGEMLRSARLERGFTLKRAAAACGLALGTFSNYESGGSDLRRERVEEMVRCLRAG